jgi:PPOX class probable F420-dependent enzyme
VSIKRDPGITAGLSASEPVEAGLEPVADIDDTTVSFIVTHRVARFATAGAGGQPLVVPICYVFERGVFYSALDEKPKRVDASRLQRVRNIEENPLAALVIDDYSDDWSQLAWVLVNGRAEIIHPGNNEHQRAVELLREKYEQYRSMAIDKAPLIRLVPNAIKHWRSSAEVKQ